MLATKIEMPKEFGTVFLFHGLGVGLEMFKVNHGGWSYPEEAWWKLLGVPLYSGFMYASVGSFILACWKRFEIELVEFRSQRAMTILMVLIYANFFTNYWILDMKPTLLAVALWLFWKTKLVVRNPLSDGDEKARVPLFALFPTLGLALWLAENVGTLFGSWQYPRQTHGWTFVPPDKLLSWTVLVMVSFLLVASLFRDEGARDVDRDLA